MLEKFQSLVETHPSVQSSFQKLNFDYNCQKKHTRLDNKFLKSCPILPNFFTFCQIFVQDCLSKQIFGRNSGQSPSNLNFLTFSVTLKHLSNQDKNKKQGSCVKVPNLMVLC